MLDRLCIIPRVPYYYYYLTCCIECLLFIELLGNHYSLSSCLLLAFNVSLRLFMGFEGRHQDNLHKLIYFATLRYPMVGHINNISVFVIWHLRGTLSGNYPRNKHFELICSVICLFFVMFIIYRLIQEKMY